jgi:hypothetical protein
VSIRLLSSSHASSPRICDNQLPAAARRLGIGVVKSIDQCLDILTQVDAPAALSSEYNSRNACNAFNVRISVIDISK